MDGDPLRTGDDRGAARLVIPAPARSARVVRETREARRAPLGTDCIGGLMAFRGSFPGRLPDPVPGFLATPRPGVFGTGDRWASFLSIEIQGRSYGLRVGPDAFTLEKPDGGQYEVARGDDSACNCGDARYRRNGLDAGGCKHRRALVEVGLLPPAPRLSPISDSGPLSRPADSPMTCAELDAARVFGMG